MNYDIIIAGAGPAGLSFARSLANTGLRVAIVEKQVEQALAEPEFDGRDVALTHLSVRILKELGIWGRLSPEDTPAIREARVLDGRSPYSLTFDATAGTDNVLGHIVSNHVIRRALFDEVQTVDNVQLFSGVAVTAVATNDQHVSVALSDERTMQAALLVAADSRLSETRRMAGIPVSMYDFGRICIVSRMTHENPHDGIAFECFHYGRTLAVLPLTGKCSSIVVTAPRNQSDTIMGMDNEDFSADIQRRFDNRYGAMALCTERFAYPLVGVHAQAFCAQRIALIGDAAVGMHPVTAHGYNLGLSGQEILAKEIISATVSRRDIGASALLQRYQRRHRVMTAPMYYGTNGVVKLFTDDRRPARLARKVALRLANRVAPLKGMIRHKLTETANTGF